MKKACRNFILFLGLVSGLVGQESAELTVSVFGEALSFRLETDRPGAPWVLQHWIDGDGWSDLIFLEPENDGAAPSADFSPLALPTGGRKTGLFRAFDRGGNSVGYRDFLAARVRWREADVTMYDYTFVTYNQLGPTETRQKVKNGEIVFDGPISIGEPDFRRTIDEWFERIGDAFASGAPVIDIDWNEEFGYPERGYLDLDERIADEEINFEITAFLPLGKAGPEYQEFLLARDRWVKGGHDDYRYVISYRAGIIFEEVRFTVRNGVVVEAEKLRGSFGNDGPPRVIPADVTIDDWIAEIEEAFEREVLLVEVEWDPEHHFPGEAYLDNFPGMEDGSRGWSLTEFTPLSGGD